MGNFLDGGALPPEQAQYYVSPNGTGTGATKNDPTSLNVALASGKDIYMTDGVYTQDRLDILAGAKVRAVAGARPIVIHSDGSPPIVELNINAEVHGIWFGGKKPAADNGHFVLAKPGAKMYDCVLFGFANGIGGGANDANLYEGCRFVNCGIDPYWHTIYITGQPSGAGATIHHCIFISGDGYQLHLWHNPTNTEIRNNFVGGSDHILAFQGSGHVCDSNIFWKPVSAGSPINLSTGIGRTYTHNYHGPIASNDWTDGTRPDGISMSGNYYYAGTANVDPAPNYTRAGDEIILLGTSADNIDAAVFALGAAFGQTAQQIHDDVTIDVNFATLQAVLDKWGAV